MTHHHDHIPGALIAVYVLAGLSVACAVLTKLATGEASETLARMSAFALGSAIYWTAVLGFRFLRRSR